MVGWDMGRGKRGAGRLMRMRWRDLEGGSEGTGSIWYIEGGANGRGKMKWMGERVRDGG